MRSLFYANEINEINQRVEGTIRLSIAYTVVLMPRNILTTPIVSITLSLSNSHAYRGSNRIRKNPKEMRAMSEPNTAMSTVERYYENYGIRAKELKNEG